MKANIAIIGSEGIPAQYGGFETLVENLVNYHYQINSRLAIKVYCSSKAFPNRAPKFLGANLEYININSHGISSIIYDSYSLFKSVISGDRVILILGLGAGFVLPLARLISSSRIIVNVDGAEWRRTKFPLYQRIVIKVLAYFNLWFAHELIADNQEIAEIIENMTGRESKTIAYGGDHSQEFDRNKNINFEKNLPDAYFLALCRIEPENNIEMILRSFINFNKENLVFIGNWNNSKYGKILKKKYSKYKNIHLMNPVFEKNSLYYIRSKSKAYIHGHSVGGTNPSLVEMMFFEKPIFAFDCSFNKYTTENHALFFGDSESLRNLINYTKKEHLDAVAKNSFLLAQKKYTWKKIGKEYFDLFENHI